MESDRLAGIARDEQSAATSAEQQAASNAANQAALAKLSAAQQAGVKASIAQGASLAAALGMMGASQQQATQSAASTQASQKLAADEMAALKATKGSHLSTGKAGAEYKLQDLNQSLAGLDPYLAQLLKRGDMDVRPIEETLGQVAQNDEEEAAPYARGGQVVGLGGLAHGGEAAKYHPEAPKGHYPEFISGKSDQYARGRGDGQSDDIPSMLGEGDYVMDADVVSALGNGSSKGGAEALQKMRLKVGGLPTTPKKYIPALIADGEVVLPAAVVAKIGNGNNKLGAQKLDKMREAVRTHNRSAPTTKIPFKAKSPLDYLKMAQRG